MARSIFGKAGRTAVTLVVVLAGVGAAGYAARDSLAALAPAPPTDVAAISERAAQPVRITRVTFASTETADSYTGTIRPRHDVPLGFRMAGKLIDRRVDVGDPVKAGQILAQLDDADARLELDAAKAEEAAALTDLARAEADLARSRDLFTAGHVAQAALDRAISAAAEALSRADRAARMRALATNRLSYMALVAAADGIVTGTLAEPGQVVAAGQPVLSLAEGDGRDVIFALPEQNRALLETATARAELWGVSDKRYVLALRDISPDVEPVGRTYRVRMTLMAPDSEATLGRTVTVRLATPGAQPAAALPLASVVNDGAGAAVWRLPKGMDHVERVPVDLIRIAGAVAVLRGPLEPDDRVVSLGASKIDPSRPVRVVETAPSPES